MSSQAVDEMLFKEARQAWQHLTREQFDNAKTLTKSRLQSVVSLVDFKRLLWEEIEETLNGETLSPLSF